MRIVKDDRQGNIIEIDYPNTYSGVGAISSLFRRFGKRWLPNTTSVLDNTLPIPQFSFTNLSLYPPELNFIIPESVIIDDHIQIDVSSVRDFSSLLFTIDVHLTAANIAGTDPISIAPALAGITSPANSFFRCRLIRGSTVSNWGITTKHGDIVSPIITSAANASFTENNPISFPFTTNEYCNITFSGTDGAFIEAVPTGGTSFIARLLNNINPVYANKPIYNFNIKATDYAGLTNTNAVQWAIEPVGPPTLNPLNKHGSLTLSNGNLSFQAITGIGATMGARANKQIPIGAKVYVEYEVISTSNGTYRMVTGIINATHNISLSATPSTANSSLQIGGYEAPGNGQIVGAGAATLVVGARYLLAVHRIDATTVKVWHGYNGSWKPGQNPATNTGGDTLTLNEVFVFAGVNSDNVGSVKMTAPYFYTPPSGFGSHP